MFKNLHTHFVSEAQSEELEKGMAINMGENNNMGSNTWNNDSTNNIEESGVATSDIPQKPLQSVYQEIGDYDVNKNANDINVVFNDGQIGGLQLDGTQINGMQLNSAQTNGAQGNMMGSPYSGMQNQPGMNNPYGGMQNQQGMNNPYGGVQNQQNYNAGNTTNMGTQKPNPREYISPEDNKKANMLSLISLGCFIFPIIADIIFITISALTTSEISDAFETLFDIGGVISILTFIAAIVLMIIVRVRYPKNTFGKVLMWVYIVMIVLIIIGVVVAIIACAIACNECIESLQNCPGFIYFGY